MSDDVRQKQDRFYEAATPLFDRFGYRKTTVEEICRAAGMSKRTFYDLFDDKEHFFAELTMAGMNRAVEEWPPMFGDALMASAAMDRLLHHAHIIEMQGNSYRNPPRPRSTAVPTQAAVQ